MTRDQEDYKGEKATRQCWECLKRRVICDFALPHCQKCLKNDRVCSGYGKQKPLQWVATGNVTSRRRQKVAPSTAQLNANIQAQSARRVETENINDELDEWARKLVDHYEALGKTIKADNKLEELFAMTSRRSIELVLTKELRDKATKVSTQTARTMISTRKSEDSLGPLEKALKYMTINEVPAYELRSETCEVVQAVAYFNMRVHPQHKTGDELVPNPHIMFFPIAALHLFPPAVHHNMVVLSLCHFVYSIPPEKGKSVAADKMTKILHHRGATIREISSRLTGKMRINDTTIISILMLMCCEMQQANPTNWRQHAIGLHQIFQLRGGMMDIYRSSVHLHPMIVIFVYIETLANCCSPAGKQIIMHSSADEQVANVSAMSEEIFPYTLIPPTLFEDHVRVNHLRHRAHKTLLEGADMEPLIIEACELLARIEAFSPQDWAQPGPNFDDWITIGQLFKAAVAVYLIMSYQSLGILLDCQTMKNDLLRHADSLLLHLHTALKVKRLKRFLAWPLAVAGVEAGFRNEGVRMWIERELVEMGTLVGANCPFRMRTMLRRYWDKGVYDWEECFDQPQGFLF